MSSDDWGLVEREGDPASRSAGAAFLPLTESLKQAMSNEIIIIPKIQESPEFSKLSAGKGKLVRKITVDVKNVH